MTRVVIYFLGIAHQLLPERPLIRGGDVSEKLVGLVEGYGSVDCFVLTTVWTPEFVFAAEQSEPFSLSPYHRGRLERGDVSAYPR